MEKEEAWREAHEARKEAGLSWRIQSNNHLDLLSMIYTVCSLLCELEKEEMEREEPSPRSGNW